MSKYIDADRLREEIEKTYKSEIQPWLSSISAKSAIYNWVLPLIDVLQREKPEPPTCKSCGFYENNCPFIRDKFIPYPNRVCKDYTSSVMKEQEQPKVDIEKEYAEFVDADPVYSKLVNGVVGRAIARHFAEWGAIHLNARKEGQK